MSTAPKPRAVAGQLRAYRPGASAPGMVKLSSNESTSPPAPEVVERLTEALTSLQTYPAHGGEAARQAFADHVGRTEGVEVGVDQVMVGSGSVSLLRQVYEAYLDPGDEVVVGWRSFEAYPVFATARQATEVQVPLAAGCYDLDALADAITDRTRLVVLATPNNPSGAVIGHDELVRLLDRVPSSCLVVLDHAYAEFERCIGAARPMQLLDRPNVLVLRTLSKAYALAGLRIGFGVGHPEVVGAIDAFRAPFEVSSLAQVGAIAALGTPPDVSSVEERARCVAALWAGGLPVGTGQGNFVWLPAGEATPVVDEALRAAGFLVRVFPGEGLRISFGRPADDDAWVAAVLSAWHGERLAHLRDAVADDVEGLVQRWRARGIDLPVDAGAGRQDLALQADTFALAARAWTGAPAVDG